MAIKNTDRVQLQQWKLHIDLMETLKLEAQLCEKYQHKQSMMILNVFTQQLKILQLHQLVDMVGVVITILVKINRKDIM